MELEERLSYLENVRDWQGLVEELEKGIASASGRTPSKAQFHLRLGRVLETKFLAGVKALKHFQDAYKLNPALDREPRGGAQHLLGPRQAQHGAEAPRAGAEGRAGRRRTRARCSSSSATSLADLGDYEKAAATYARSLGRERRQEPGGERLPRGRAGRERRRGRRTSPSCFAAPTRRATGAAKARLLLARGAHRAALRARRGRGHARARLRGRPASNAGRRALRRAARRAADARRARARRSARSSQQIADRERARDARARRSARAGSRAIRTSSVGARFLEEALKLDPENEGAFFFLRDAYGKKGGDWDRVLTLAEEAATHAGDNGERDVPPRAGGTIAWRQLGNLIRARALVRAPQRVVARSTRSFARSRRRSARRSRRVAPRRDGTPRPSVERTPRRAPVAAPRRRPRRAAARGLASAARRGGRGARARARAPVGRAAAAAPPSLAEAAAPAGGRRRRSPSFARSPTSRRRRSATTSTSRRSSSSPALVPDADEKVALYTKAADLYVTKFANQAEAVKAYEAVLAIDPEQRAGDRLPAPDVREASRLGEAPRSAAARGGAHAGRAPSARAKFLEIAKLATERVKKPEVCIELWHEVIANDDANAEALGALARALRARQGLREARGRAREAGRDHLRRRRRRSRSCTKLGTIYGERLNNDEGAVDAWRALLALDPQRSQGAGGAQEEVPRARPLGRPRGLLRRERQVGRVHPRPRAARGEGDRAPRRRSASSSRSPSSGPTRSRSPIAPRRRTRRSSSSSRSNLQAAEALIPIYTAANNAKALANAIEVKLAPRAGPGDEARALSRGRGPLRGQASRIRRRRSSATSSAFELAPGDERTSDGRRARGEGHRRLGRGHRGLPPGDRARRRRAATATLGDRAAPAARARPRRRGAAHRRRARRLPRRLRGGRRERRGASPRSSGSTGRRRASRISSASTRRSAISRPTRDEKKAINYEIAKLYENEIKDVDKAIDTYVAVLEDEPTDAQALAALDVLYGQLGRWEPYVDVAAPAHRARRRRGGAHRSQVPPRADAREAPRRCRRARSRTTARSSSSTRSTKGRASRSRRCSQSATCAPRPRRSSRRSTRSAATGTKLIARPRDPRATRRRTSQKRVALQRKIARISARATERLRARVRRRSPRALKDDPSLAETRDEIERVAERVERVGAARRPLRRDRRGPHATPRSRATTGCASPPSTSASARSTRRRRATAACSRSTRPTPRRSPRSSSSSRAPSAGRISSASSSAASSWPTTPQEREALYAQMAQIYDERLGQPEDAVAAYRKVLELDPASARRAHGARRALHAPEDVGRARREPRGAARARGDGRRAARAHAPPRGAARDARWARSTSRSRGTARSSSATPTNARGARRARAARQGRRSTSSTIADLLEPLYRHLGDYQKLIGVHEVQVRRSDDADAPGRAPPSDRAALRGRRRRPRTPPFATLARALKEDPANEHDAAGARSRRARDGSLRRPGAASSSSSPAQIEDPTLASALFTMSARVYENDLGNVDTADRPLPQGPRDRSAEPRRGRVARAPLPQRRALPGALAHPPAEGRDPRGARGEEGRALPGRGDRGGRARAARGGDRRLQQGPRARRRRPPRDRRAHQALPRPRRAGRTSSRVYAKKADLVADAEEKKRIYYQVGAVYERELGDVAARDRHVQRRSSSSIRTICRRSRASTSSTSRRRTGTSSSASSRTRAR